MSPPRLQEILHDVLKDESKQEGGDEMQAALVVCRSAECVKMTSRPEQTFAFKSNRQSKSKAKILARKGLIFPSITVSACHYIFSFFFYICIFFFLIALTADTHG